jgi:hypothetical protein
MKAPAAGETSRMTKYTYYAVAASGLRDSRGRVDAGSDRRIPVHMILANQNRSLCILSERIAPAQVEV